MGTAHGGWVHDGCIVHVHIRRRLDTSLLILTLLYSTYPALL